MPYLSDYPRPGQVALLCEGDLTGYEATLFQKWTGSELGNAPLVDIWCCGTSASIFGISDAIGRSRPIFVIEDRDFRSIDESRDDCTRNQQNRQAREVRVIGWHAWNRCEIENYLLEPTVLLPVFRAAFGCPEDAIIAAVNEILPALALFQASQYAMARARRLWQATDPAGVLLAGPSSRPQWNDSTRQIVRPDHVAFRAGLEKNDEAWRTRLHALQCDVLNEFDTKFELWKSCRWQDGFWRIDWAGKEVLSWLRIAMTSRFGWPVDPEASKRATLSWSVGREKRGAQDRPIEAALRPRLVDQFLAELPALTKEVRDEFNEIKVAIKSYGT
jgi:hypothetical protein